MSDVRLGQEVKSIRKIEGKGLIISFGDGIEETFDKIVLATHSDTSIEILGDLTGGEDRLEVLKSVPYRNNQIYLHKGILNSIIN